MFNNLQIFAVRDSEEKYVPSFNFLVLVPIRSMWFYCVTNVIVEWKDCD